MYVMTPLIGVVMVLIVIAVAYYITSESEQQLKLAGAATLNEGLMFIAQTIQADFYDLLMQNILGVQAVDFIGGKVHTLNPSGDFMSNIGNDLRLALEEPLSYLITEDTVRTYAIAYSGLPAITCTPRTSQGGSLSYVTLDENEDGTLDVGAVTTGQEIECVSSEPSGRTVVDLQGRAYQLNVRAVAIHDAAVEAIKNIYSQLDSSEAVYNQENWAYPEDEKILNKILENWNGMIRGFSSSMLGTRFDGLYVSPASIGISSGDGGEFYGDDFTIVCTGDVGYDGTRNCRPDELGLSIGSNVECDESAKINLDMRADRIVITSSAGLDLSITSEELVEKIKEALGDLFKVTGCLSYSGATKICKEWKGKPSSALVRGAIIEDNSRYTPPGVEAPIMFEFASTGFGLDESEIEDDLECDSEENEDLIFDNIRAILASGEGFELQIESVEGSDSSGERIERYEIVNLEELAQKINEDSMYRDTGAKILLNTNLRIPVPGSQGPDGGSPGNGGELPETIEITGQAGDSEGLVSEEAIKDVETFATGRLEGEGTEEMRETFSSGDAYDRYGAVHKVLDSVAGTAHVVGDEVSAAALSKSSGSVCKMMGLVHGMNINDMDLAFQALCGIVSTSSDQNLASVCGLGQLWAAFEGGDAGAYGLAMETLLEQAGFGSLGINADVLRQALETGDMHLSLQQVASMFPDTGAAGYLANVAGLMEALEADNLKGALDMSAGILGAYGQTNAVDILQILSGLEGTIQRGDVQGALNAMISLGGVYGVGDLEQLSYMANIAGMMRADALATMNIDMDFNDLFAECKEVNPLAFLCLTGGGACSMEHEGCTFTYGLPSFEIDILCGGMAFNGRFRLSCQCYYTCLEPPYTKARPGYLDISIEGLAAMMDLKGMGSILQMINMRASIERLRNVQYCNFDP